MKPILPDQAARIRAQYADGWPINSIAAITRHGTLAIKRILGLTAAKKSGKKVGIRRAPRAD